MPFLRFAQCGFLLLLFLPGCTGGGANQAFEIGVEFHREKEHDEAVRYLSKAIKQQPDLWDAYFYRGVSRLRLRKYDKALEDLNETISRKPEWSDAYCHRSDVWLEKGDVEQALADAEEAVRLGPENALAYFFRGQALLELGKYDAAIEDFRKQIELDPGGDHARTFVGLGRALTAKRQYEDAAFQLNKAIQLYEEQMRRFPKHQTTDPERGKVWRGKETYDAAAVAYVARGDLLVERDKRREGMEDYTRAILRNEQYKPAYFRRALLYFEAGNCFKAAEDLEKIVQIDPESAKAHAAWAWVLATCPEARHRDDWAAVQKAKKAVELLGGEASDPFFHEALAAAYAEAENFSAAVREQQKALERVGGDQKNEMLKVEMQQRLDLYQSRKPFRDTRPGQRWK